MYQYFRVCGYSGIIFRVLTLYGGVKRCIAYVHISFIGFLSTSIQDMIFYTHELFSNMNACIVYQVFAQSCRTL